MTGLLIYTVVLFALAVVLVGLQRRRAMRRALLDIPNERSSHQQPVPTGGGLGIAIPLLLWVAVYIVNGNGPAELVYGIGIGGALVAVTGYLDDHFHLPAPVRFISYLAAAVIAVVCLGGMPSVYVGSGRLDTGVAGAVFAVLFIAWLTNLYNFMDGIDGLAATEAMYVAIVSAVLFYLVGAREALLLCVLVFSCSAGFLVWNWPPARIFMGDTGSCLLGYTFAVLAVYGENSDKLPLLFWCVALSVFIADATLTLFYRIMRRERWYSAHRGHAYQRLHQLGYSHEQVVTAIAILNLVLLTPLIYLMYSSERAVLPVVLASGVVLAATWWTIQRSFNNADAGE